MTIWFCDYCNPEQLVSSRSGVLITAAAQIRTLIQHGWCEEAEVVATDYGTNEVERRHVCEACSKKRRRHS